MVSMMLLSKPAPTGKFEPTIGDNPIALSSSPILTVIFRYMGSLSNNARKLANFAGFYKGIQSAGGAGMWR